MTIRNNNTQYIDNKFNTIKYDGTFNFRKLIDDILVFLKDEGVEQKILDDMDIEAELMDIMFCKGEATYSVYADGKLLNMKYPNSAGAFTFMSRKETLPDSWDMTVGMCFRNDDVEKYYHKVVHELFHALSTKTKLMFDDQGHCYTKIGFLIKEYDREENLVDKSLAADGLNEGFTEYLAAKFCHEKAQNYNLQEILMSIMAKDNKNMINAYFSRDKKDVLKFYQEFEEKQDVMKAQELIGMSKNIIFDPDAQFAYLDMAINYALNKNMTMDEYNREIERIKALVSPLDEMLDYNETTGTPFMDHVNDFIKNKAY